MLIPGKSVEPKVLMPNWLRRETAARWCCKPSREECRELPRCSNSGRSVLRIGERSHLTAGIEMLCEPGNVGIGVRRGGGVVLIVVFGRKGILGALVPVEIRHRLVGE